MRTVRKLKVRWFPCTFVPSLLAGVISQGYHTGDKSLGLLGIHLVRIKLIIIVFSAFYSKSAINCIFKLHNKKEKKKKEKYTKI